MASVSDSGIHVADIIERRAIETHFQPITSIRQGAIIGVEALSRGLTPTGGIIAPVPLFEAAAQQGLTLELDRLCRDKAIENFLPLHSNSDDLILFVNFQASTADRSVFGADSILRTVQAAGLDPRNVAIEIVEAEFQDVARLRQLVEHYKQSGFLVVVDDIGAGYSNLDRIIYVQPDILKADRALVQEMDKDYYKREVFQALVKLSEKIGGWVITEGVETEAEAITALDMGADMLQGFYYARPHLVDRAGKPSWEVERVQETASRFRGYMVDKTKRLRSQRDKRMAAMHDLAVQLHEMEADQFEEGLAAAVGEHPIIESACVLDGSGVQVTETVWFPTEVKREKTIIFSPPVRGTDHSWKEYYYLLQGTGIDPFETTPYVPTPSAQLCITVSASFEDAAGTPFILCLHMNALEQEIWR